MDIVRGNMGEWPRGSEARGGEAREARREEKKNGVSFKSFFAAVLFQHPPPRFALPPLVGPFQPSSAMLACWLHSFYMPCTLCGAEVPQQIVSYCQAQGYKVIYCLSCLRLTGGGS